MKRLVRAAPPAVAAVGLALLCACGPASGLDVGVRHEGVGVLFGTPTPSPSTVVTPPPPPPGAEPVPNFPAPLIAPPPPLTATTVRVTPTPHVATLGPTPASNACPAPSPVTYPREAATTTATQPPAQATYDFRYSGTDTSNPGTSTARATKLPAAGTRSVRDVTAPAADGHYTFDVVEGYNALTTTTTYLVEPKGSNTSGASSPGLYMQEMKSVDSAGQTSDFTPQPPVELLPFPANPGTTFQSAGVDPITQTAMEEDSPGGTVGNRTRVATCGDVVDSWQVDITGRFVNQRGSAVTGFDITLDVAPQYGGLIVAEHVVENGTDTSSGQPYTYDVTAAIDSVPLDAGKPA